MPDNFVPVRQVTEEFEPVRMVEDIFTPVRKVIPKKPLGIRALEQYRENLMAPMRAITQTITESAGLEKPSEYISRIPFLKQREEKWTPSFLRSFVGGVAGEMADIYSRPLAHLMVPAVKDLGKVVSKIPIRGTTLGQIAKRVPIGKGFGERVKELARLDQWLKTYTPLTSRGQVQVGQIAVQKVTQAIKEATPIRTLQESIYTAERAKRAGAIAGIGKRVPGEKGYFAQLKALKGELAKVQYEGIRGRLNQTDVDSLFNLVEQSRTLSPFEKIATKNGLSKLLGAEGGVIPTRGEISLLREVFPEEFVSAVLGKQPLLQRIGQGIAEVLNVPRAIMASADMSAPLRQGVFLVGRPKRFFSAFGNMFKYFFREKSYQGLINEIKSRPTYPLMKESKLALTEIGARLAGREEAFMSQLAEKIPIAGWIVRASNRAYTGFLNKLRADVFDDILAGAQKAGHSLSGRLLHDTARFVSAATGRGSLGQLEGAAVILNTTLFSPRLMASRLNLMNPGFYMGLDPFVRKQALRALFTFAGLGSTAVSLAKMGGAKVETNPRNADFGKIRIGNTRYDPWGGFQQYIRAATQIITGEVISSTTGTKMVLGEGYRPLTRYDILARSIEMKQAPVLSFFTTMLRGRTMGERTFNLQAEIINRFTPMVIQDMWDIKKELGIDQVFRAFPGLFGVGVQTYAPNASGVVGAMNSVTKQVNEMLRQGRVDEAIALRDKNKIFIQQGIVLTPYQTVINTLRRLKKDMSKNPNLKGQERRQVLDRYDTTIKEWETRMEQKFGEIKTFTPVRRVESETFIPVRMVE